MIRFRCISGESECADIANLHAGIECSLAAERIKHDRALRCKTQKRGKVTLRIGSRHSDKAGDSLSRNPVQGAFGVRRGADVFKRIKFTDHRNLQIGCGRKSSAAD